MSRVSDANSLPSGGLGAGAASGAPQATSPSKPAGAVDILYHGLSFMAEAAVLASSRRCPVDPPFFLGCSFGVLGDVWACGTHTGQDIYKTSGDVAVEQSCDFQGTGVPGANVYPALPGCPHQAASGKAKVIKAELMTGGIGNCVILEHMDSAHLVQMRTVYMHLASLAVSAGQFVSTTDVIGTVGYTGLENYGGVGNSHLHFELWAKQSSHPSWRVAAEVLPDSIQCERPGAVDPAIWFPNCFPSDEISIAALWIPNARFPVVGGASIEFHADPYVKVYGPNLGVMGIYPFLDGPDGLVRILHKTVVEPDTHVLILLHDISPSDAVLVTGYEFGVEEGGSIVIPVVAGDWVGLNTLLATLTPAVGVGNVNIFVWRLPVIEGESQDYADFDILWWLATPFLVNPSSYYDFGNAGLPYI